MSWEDKRVYECSLCHRKESECLVNELPLGWNGDGGEHGTCYCDECSEKILSYNRTARFISLDGSSERCVCTGCGTSFDVVDLSVDGNTFPNRCPSCHRRTR